MKGESMLLPEEVDGEKKKSPYKPEPFEHSTCLMFLQCMPPTSYGCLSSADAALHSALTRLLRSPNAMSGSAAAVAEKLVEAASEDF
jgi:hypothetical protein